MSDQVRSRLEDAAAREDSALALPSTARRPSPGAFSMAQFANDLLRGHALALSVLSASARTPYPELCDRAACRGLMRCPKDPVCND